VRKASGFPRAGPLTLMISIGLLCGKAKPLRTADGGAAETRLFTHTLKGSHEPAPQGSIRHIDPGIVPAPLSSWLPQCGPFQGQANRGTSFPGAVPPATSGIPFGDSQKTILPAHMAANGLSAVGGWRRPLSLRPSESAGRRAVLTLCASLRLSIVRK